MDPSNISVICLNIKKDNLEEYVCEEKHVLGMKMTHLSKILKFADNKDSLTLKYKKGTSDKLHIEFKGGKGTKTTKFEMNLMEINEDDGFAMDDDYDCNLTLNSDEFKRIIQNLTAFGDECNVTIDKKTIDFSVKGDLGTGNIAIEDDEESEESMFESNGSSINTKFSTEYLNTFTKATSLCKSVKLGLSEGLPILVKYDLEDDGGHLKFYLVPKTENS